VRWLEPFMSPADHEVQRGALTIISDISSFTDWPGLLAIILRAFDYMNGRIDPPSSALALTPESLKRKAAVETVFLAYLSERLVGCAFLAEKRDHFYLGKLAVEPACQGRGIGKALMAVAEAHALKAGKPVIELQTRVELLENHRAFTCLGFRETARTAHAGYDRPTSLTMRKVLA
jgi:GNAT superfamily N-acetyltransferase